MNNIFWSLPAKTAFEILDPPLEPVIWYSHNPDEICGFYWLLGSSKSLQSQYMLSNCRNGNTLPITPFHWLGRNLARRMGKYLPCNGGQTGIIKCLCYALKQPSRKRSLRIYLNGKLQSASENIYDGFYSARGGRASGRIFRSKPNWECPRPPSEMLLRMEKFIKEGMFTIVTTPSADDLIYHRTLRKC